MAIMVKRVYEKPLSSDGMRILIDRLWPRGLSKENAQIDFWAKEAAPSAELRQWFNHQPDRWEEFCRRYFRELNGQLKVSDSALNQVLSWSSARHVTLLYAASNEHYNNALALKKYITRLLERRRKAA